MAMGIIEMARLNQIVVVTPFTLLGAMAPVTLAGGLVEQNAEALAGLALSQLTRPGAPFVYGGFTSNVDMKSGAPAFGTPEYMKACIIGGQLARRYRLPYRTSSTNAANSVDAQAAYETVFSLWGAIMGGGNIIQHAAGWMEGGLVASYEKFALDVDLLQMVQEFLKPVVVDDDAMAFSAMEEVGPGGHFFGAQHTLERYSTAFYQPLISDWRNFPNWEASGRPTAEKKANALWKQALAEYQPPPSRPRSAGGDRRLRGEARGRRRREDGLLVAGIDEPRRGRGRVLRRPAPFHRRAAGPSPAHRAGGRTEGRRALFPASGRIAEAVAGGLVGHQCCPGNRGARLRRCRAPAVRRVPDRSPLISAVRMWLMMVEICPKQCDCLNMEELP